ncbi:hypothetical protein INT47_009318 [Mucor saturninus]|uniref:FYVE-type domain-containing protein n=1 Tax=Mucor saturninus TaxID=64648 RepID=A0A8H7QPB5_9FUNG|nr:hypothetical protein INT47_009318 [Mucor saturninus]
MNTNDDRLTFLLPRPVWVNDLDVSYCSSCNNAFGPLKRRHHCRNCGNIFCHDCSSRKVPLPQLGDGTKPVRVCNGCFDVAYLVTYAIDEDHGISTQIHGVRGLLELTEKDDEKDLHNMVAYGGVDALIWLCRSSKSIKLHHLTTTILAMLAEKESIRPVIITKWALPPLLHLIRYYTNTEILLKKSPTSSIRSNSSNPLDEIATTETRQSIILEIIINCTHILYQLSRAGIFSQKEVVTEGVFDTLFTLASFDHIQSDATNEEQQQINERLAIIQNLAAKSISAISSLVAFQASIIELIQGTPKLSSLLRSSNDDVRKYIAKTIAYLSLRNDKYKPNLLCGDGSRALVSILVVLPQKEPSDNKTRMKDLEYYLSQDIQDDLYTEITSIKEDHHLNSAAVSHTCCALANFATNNESQVNLMAQPRFLQYLCNVPAIFSEHAEIHRHVARCLANLALYEENNISMLTSQNGKGDNKDAYNVLPTLLFMGKSDSETHIVQRHIVRAIDNLNSNFRPKNGRWKGLFNDACVYIRKVLDNYDGNEKDLDTIKRAKSILAREKLENEHHPTVKAVVSAIENTPPVTTPAPTQVSTSVIEQTENRVEQEDASSSPPTSEDEAAVVQEDAYNLQALITTPVSTSNEEETDEPKASPPPATKNKRRSKKNKKWE